MSDKEQPNDSRRHGRDGKIGVACGVWILNTKTGEVEFGETSEDAAKREALEEAGAEIEITAGPFIREWITPGDKHVLTLDYIAKHVGGDISNQEPDKHDEVKWFSIDDLPNNLLHYTEVLSSLRGS
jgi:ADP-ribose pyrophosphatase YjhB (NUDIX family)